MRTSLPATAALLGLAFAAPAFAQSDPAASPAPDGTTPHMTHRHHVTPAGDGETFAHEPGRGESGPASAKASNIDQADSRSDIAPHFPTPLAGRDATADAYLGAARRALQAHRTGEAQQALEMAETRLLDRSTPVQAAGQPMQSPQIQHISMAREALGHGDSQGAVQAITLALSSNPDAGQAPPHALP